MARRNLNLDSKIGGRKCKVRKRGCSSSSSSSSSSLYRNYGLKRVFLVGKRVGSSTPEPKWKILSGESPPSLENDDGSIFKYLTAAAKGGSGGGKAKELSVSARKLAATLWEIDGLPSTRILKRRDNWDEKINERMDITKVGSHRRRASASAGSQKFLQADCNLGAAKSIHDCSVEVDQTHNPARSPCRNVIGSKNHLKDVYNGLTTCKELLKVMSRITHFDQRNSTSLSLFTALKFELDRACAHIAKLVQEQNTNRFDIDVLLKHFEEEKIIWKLKEQDRIRSAVTSIASELDTERKLRGQTERLNKKLGRELSETKAFLLNVNKDFESEKRAREILEQVCDELARGIGEDRAEAEELKRQSAKVCEEVEKEREMLQLADILREERVQMKLSEAKYQFEEKNAVVDNLRNELEAYLKSKKGEEQENGSPSYDKIRELEKYLRETLPCPYHEYEDNEKNEIEMVNNNEDDDDDDEEETDDSSDSDLHSIELNMDDVTKGFQWSDAVKKEKKRNSFEKRKKIKRPIFPSEKKLGDVVEWENLDVFEKRGVFEFASSQPWKKKDTDEDEIERYNMIKDLRDHIVSGSKMASSQDSASPTQNDFGSKDHNGVVCQG